MANHWSVVVRYKYQGGEIKHCLYEAYEANGDFMATYRDITPEKFGELSGSIAESIYWLSINENDAKLFCYSFTAEKRNYNVFSQNCQGFVREFIMEFNNGIPPKIWPSEDSTIIWSSGVLLFSSLVSLLVYLAITSYFKFEERTILDSMSICMLLFLFIRNGFSLRSTTMWQDSPRLPLGSLNLAPILNALPYILGIALSFVLCILFSYLISNETLRYYFIASLIMSFSRLYNSLSDRELPTIFYVPLFFVLFIHNGANLYTTIFNLLISLYVRVFFKWLPDNCPPMGHNGSRVFFSRFSVESTFFNCFFTDPDFGTIFIYSLFMGFKRMDQLRDDLGLSWVKMFWAVVGTLQITIPPYVLLPYQTWLQEQGYLNFAEDPDECCRLQLITGSVFGFTLPVLKSFIGYLNTNFVF